MNKKEFKELDREQMIIAFNQLKDDYSVLFDKLEQEKNKINTIKKIMSIGDVTDEALFTLVQTTMAELERLEGIEEKLDNSIEMIKDLKEKNKKLEEKQNSLAFKTNQYMNEVLTDNIISKDKIKAIQGQLIMQLGSYVRDEASPEQERIAGGINIINKILKGE